MNKLVTVLVGLTLHLLNITAHAEILQATWDGSIRAISSNLVLFDSETDLASTDIFNGATVSGKVVINTDLSGPDLDGSSFTYFANPTEGQPIGPSPYFMTITLELNGNTFSPVLEDRPSATFVTGGDADQELEMNYFFSGRFFVNTDWDTLFDGVEHNRGLYIDGSSANLDVLSIPTTGLASALLNSDLSDFSGTGNATVRDNTLPPGSNFALFSFSVDNMSDFSVVPIPPAVWLFGSGLLGLVGVARRKQA